MKRWDQLLIIMKYSVAPLGVASYIVFSYTVIMPVRIFLNDEITPVYRRCLRHVVFSWLCSKCLVVFNYLHGGGLLRAPLAHQSFIPTQGGWERAVSLTEYVDKRAERCGNTTVVTPKSRMPVPGGRTHTRMICQRVVSLLVEWTCNDLDL